MEGDGWIPGLGGNKPQARPMGKAFFGHIPDAFSLNNMEMPSERSSANSSRVTIDIVYMYLSR